jgi:hypothetical protein
MKINLILKFIFKKMSTDHLLEYIIFGRRYRDEESKVLDKINRYKEYCKGKSMVEFCQKRLRPLINL